MLKNDVGLSLKEAREALKRILPILANSKTTCKGTFIAAEFFEFGFLPVNVDVDMAKKAYINSLSSCKKGTFQYIVSEQKIKTLK